LESHNTRIKLRQPVTVVRMFGIRRQADVLLFAVDAPQVLIETLKTASQSRQTVPAGS
jgi:hypothetical protein